MRTVRLLRIDTSFEHGTFGTWIVDGEVFCCTLEPKEFQNKKSVSCIPAGQYICRRKISPSHGVCFQVMNVPDRDDVLIHPGNTDDDTEGCILLGSSYGKLGKDRAVLNSGATYKGFMESMEGDDEFKLTIVEVF